MKLVYASCAVQKPITSQKVDHNYCEVSDTRNWMFVVSRHQRHPQWRYATIAMINKVSQRLAGLVARWVTVSG